MLRFIWYIGFRGSRMFCYNNNDSKQSTNCLGSFVDRFEDGGWCHQKLYRRRRFLFVSFLFEFLAIQNCYTGPVKMCALARVITCLKTDA